MEWNDGMERWNEIVERPRPHGNSSGCSDKTEPWNNIIMTNSTLYH